ncbi:hypothetical protein OH807_39810 [Kitasatospora sp. NBC_01560]|uniref:hypothetical protein n=1 Tax=Kitasatospora sp. NBC_01560 TaxID=2975965 RepID=UPI003869D11A
MSDSAEMRIFTMLDANGDGAISDGEHLARVDRAAAATGRDRRDPLVADGDGAVDRAAYLAGIHDYLLAGASPMADAYGAGLPAPQGA